MPLETLVRAARIVLAAASWEPGEEQHRRRRSCRYTLDTYFTEEMNWLD